jgi:hypothetical protein
MLISYPELVGFKKCTLSLTDTFLAERLAPIRCMLLLCGIVIASLLRALQQSEDEPDQPRAHPV